MAALCPRWVRCAAFPALAALLACSTSKDKPAPPAPASAAVSAPLAPSALPTSTVKATLLPPAARQGSAIVRSPKEDALLVADEDHKVLRRVSLPLGPGSAITTIPLPGAPAQVLAFEGAVLVTIRDPGLLLVFAPDAAGDLAEQKRVALPADAWGLAVSRDARFAFVTSAWTHEVSKVDLEAGKVVWSADVAREPRGVLVLDAGEALVSHLVGPDLTRVREANGAPSVETIETLPSPVRAPSGKKLHASLGYALVTSPEEDRLFVARHAVGALARRSWFGQPTVDVLLLPGPGRAAVEQLAARHRGGLPGAKSGVADLTMTADTPTGIPGRDKGPFTQPRAMVFRKKTRTLLVAGEGDDVVAELDAVALDPTLAIVRTFQVGQKYDPGAGTAGECGAPSGLALSFDEDTAWVLCRSTYDVVALDLRGDAPKDPVVRERLALLHLADDPLPASEAKGRRLFYNATDPVVSGGLGCAGCHPEGRDDGHVWHEAAFDTVDGLHTNFVGAYEDIPDLAKTKGVPRRTPMIAGMVDAPGPYGWHGESPDLPSRIEAGMGLHRWGGLPQDVGGAPQGRATLIAAFVRAGLVPPPREARELSALEKRGQEIFRSDRARCSKCHVPENGYTDRTAYPLKHLSPVSGFEDEKKDEFKTPSLRNVGGRAPYFHDGRASSLEKLVELNSDRMGDTSHLSAEDREALVAFLRTL